MRRAALLLVLALAAPAGAEPWVWQDETGTDVFTDDPSLVPEARRHTLRRLGDAQDDEGGWYSGVDTSDDPAREADRRAADARALQRQSLVRQLERLTGELATLERERVQADNEYRRYKVGGRIGAADRAAAARVRVEALDRRLAELRADVARAEAALALGE